jgi:hypothetical protein
MHVFCYLPILLYFWRRPPFCFRDDVKLTLFWRKGDEKETLPGWLVMRKTTKVRIPSGLPFNICSFGLFWKPLPGVVILQTHPPNGSVTNSETKLNMSTLSIAAATVCLPHEWLHASATHIRSTSGWLVGCLDWDGPWGGRQYVTATVAGNAVFFLPSCRRERLDRSILIPFRGQGCQVLIWLWINIALQPPGSWDWNGVWVCWLRGARQDIYFLPKLTFWQHLAMTQGKRGCLQRGKRTNDVKHSRIKRKLLESPKKKLWWHFSSIWSLYIWHILRARVTILLLLLQNDHKQYRTKCRVGSVHHVTSWIQACNWAVCKWLHNFAGFWGILLLVHFWQAQNGDCYRFCKAKF